MKENMSPPSRWCGLKLDSIKDKFFSIFVTTFAVVWIEILWLYPIVLAWLRHHLRGGVD